MYISRKMVLILTHNCVVSLNYVLRNEICYLKIAANLRCLRISWQLHKYLLQKLLLSFLTAMHIHKKHLWEKLRNTKKLTVLDVWYEFLSGDTARCLLSYKHSLSFLSEAQRRHLVLHVYYFSLSSVSHRNLVKFSVKTSQYNSGRTNYCWFLFSENSKLLSLIAKL